MLNILLVEAGRKILELLAQRLAMREGVAIQWAESPETALAAIERDRLQVVVMGLAQPVSVALTKEVVKRDPFINCALTSSLSAEEFHEATEGLGIFMQLPEKPGADEADKMLEILESIGVVIGNV